MVHFCQLILYTDDVILKLYTSLYQKAKCTLFAWSTVIIDFFCLVYIQEKNIKNVTRCRDNRSVHNSTLHIFNVERYVGWGCVLNCFMLSSLPCLYAFADLLSVHLITFLMFLFILVISRYTIVSQYALHFAHYFGSNMGKDLYTQIFS